MSLLDLHRQRNRLQRTHLTPSIRPAYIVLLPDPLYALAQNTRLTTSIRTIQDGSYRPTHQHVCAMLPDLCRTLDAVSTGLASNRR